MKLTDEQVALVQRLQRGQFGDVNFDPFEVGSSCSFPGPRMAQKKCNALTRAVPTACGGLLQRRPHDPPGYQQTR